MNRTGLIIALAIAAVVGLTFGFYPELDLKISAWFFEHVGWRTFDTSGWDMLRDVAMWVIVLIAAPAAIALAIKLIRPHTRLLVPGRAIILLLGTLALGPGLMTNVFLKDHWGRSRPADIVQFRGPDRFTPWWDWRGDCTNNCSFVAGEPSGAFWTLAPAAVTPAAWRAYATTAAVLFGIGVGALRMAFGAHFLTDVVFAGVFTFLLIWCVHGLLYRWRPTRISDESVERALETVSPTRWFRHKRRAEERS
jgi:membrane-associated PAP2 superfamily phosphatase